MVTLKTSLRALPLVVHITKCVELKELQQHVVKDQKCQRQRSMQLDEFQDLGTQISVKEFVSLQVVQEGKKEVAEKIMEHPLAHDLTGSWEIAEKVKAQVREIT